VSLAVPIPTLPIATYRVMDDCVMISVLHYAAFITLIDDLCTWRGSGLPLLEKAEQ